MKTTLQSLGKEFTILSLFSTTTLACLLCAEFFIAAAPAATPKVDFSYAFATPHRITVGRPDASDRTLLDLQPGNLRMAWTYDHLAMPQYPLNAFKTPKTDWDIRITPQIDGHAFARSRWTRLDGVLPALENDYEDNTGRVRLEVVGGTTAAVVRVEIAAADSQPHQVVLRCESARWGENPGWVEPAQYAGDNMVAGWNERADRVLVLGLNADTYSLQNDGRPPSPRSMVLVWNLKPGEKRVGWIVRPYRAYGADLPMLRKHDWAKEMNAGRREWRDLLGRATKLSIPDPGVANGYLACLADLFIMREPAVHGYLGAVPGTETYRAHNPAEAGIVAIALDQNGFHRESTDGYRNEIDMQEADGNWNDHRGWGHLVWICSGFKSWVAIEHYRLTRDRKYLAAVYPRMAASSRWQEHQRMRTRHAGGDRPLTYGLMPRGFGDCGVKDGDDLYGQFLPHNIWAVYADRISWETAEILKKTADAAELKKIYDNARFDLLTAIERGAIQGNGYRWIPGVPGKTSGSRWGVLNAAFPCGLLAPDHELISGTLRHIESWLSPGGIPVNTGWLTNGMWVAITLDNVAEVHLQRGNGDAAARYLYATLNHGTPLYTWCEERGQEAGSAKCTGDRQHLWTPVAVVRALRDMMVMERNDGLDLALGTERAWLALGKPVGIANAPTHFGRVSYRMEHAPSSSTVTGEVKFASGSTAAWAVLHIRLPNGLKVKSVDSQSGAVVEPDGSGIRWKSPQGVKKFHVVVEN
ncbi:MAG: hypothetical protein NTY01_25210 [Verrucomicrobia bacterium]|nr:hypothetical protein [Verrucomicrobiota bacterium]